MATICTKCNCKNSNDATICAGCGTELTPSKKQKKTKINQTQDPAIRSIISIILIAAIVLCLITFIQYIFGRQPLLVQNEQNEMVNISFANNWNIWGNMFEASSEFDMANPNTLHCICRIVCHLYGCIFYFALTALLCFTTYLVFTKSYKAKMFSIISGIAGLSVIIIGFLLGFFLVVRNAAGIQFSRALPQLTALMLFPLFAQLPFLGLMLQNREKAENNA